MTEQEAIPFPTMNGGRHCCRELAVSAWVCAAHGIATNGDCPRCDDELIAMTEEVSHG